MNPASVPTSTSTSFSVYPDFSSVVTVAAVHTSVSTFCWDYTANVNRVLQTLSAPLSLIEWSDTINLTHFMTTIPKFINFPVTSGSKPEVFMNLLRGFNRPINLYIFTNGKIYHENVKNCQLILQEHENIVINHVYLYYYGRKRCMNYTFMHVFRDIPTTMHVNGERLRMDPAFHFDNVNYDYIMKDDSFKTAILFMLNSSSNDKEALKKMVCDKSASALKTYFKEKLSIENFYRSDDIEGAMQYIEKQSSYDHRFVFQLKLAVILNLFDPSDELYLKSSFSTIAKITDLICKEPELECEYLNFDALCENRKTICIPIKKCTDEFWSDKKASRSPFAILGSKSLVNKVSDLVELYIMNNDTVREQMDDPEDKTGLPLTREVMQGAYVLNNGTINPTDLIRHNNCVLSNLFQNKLPGKDVLWHIVFLYILAQKQFPELKERLYEEIRFLGKQREHFLSLDPHFNPPIVEKLETCFWYIAHVCHKTFPKKKKNILRRLQLNPRFFVQFYEEVYKPNYIAPIQLSVWQLWQTLRNDPLSIFPILSHYLESEKLNNDFRDPFQYALYKEWKPPSERSFSESYSYLALLDIETVLMVIRNVSRRRRAFNCDDIKLKREWSDLINERSGTEDKLDHVKIHLRTCHPLVTCPETQRHWKNCIGDYDVLKESNVRLFRRYCQEYKKYPSDWKDLLRYQNECLYRLQNGVPELFSRSTRKTLETVMRIFDKVMRRYRCEIYLSNAESYREEKLRIEMEEKYAYDNPLNICIHCFEINPDCKNCHCKKDRCAKVEEAFCKLNDLINDIMIEINDDY